MTRPQEASEALAARIDCPGLRVVISPVMRIEGRAVQPPAEAAGLIFTSAHGVAEAARQDLLRDLPVFAVGEATAQAARANGWPATCAGLTADELVETLSRHPPETPLLHLRGTHARGDIAGRLTRAGLPTTEAVIYDQVAQPLSSRARDALNGADPVILPVFSPRSARLLVANLKPLAPLHVVALSSAVAEAFHGFDTASLHICESPGREEMDAALNALALGLCRVEGYAGEH
ncbi:hypothetical protein ATO3_06405 [Marinibacterium profundimaris]|uniref:Tetrapyrrole biosynthesis uroporphyrinogen III synthase domain-containing protein n=1 Tax=Marinibacterium profundimaris TaxID=1679460 RepID=A0A225NP76_9RHOB|nr:hypothetical protein ATO3_06405 [Marinibacterium profundimaris]